MSYDNTNRGALFKNTKKEDERHADYNGSVNVDGKEYWLNAWINESKDGKKYMSLSVKPKEAVTQAARQAVNETPAVTVDDDSIPF